MSKIVLEAKNEETIEIKSRIGVWNGKKGKYDVREFSCFIHIDNNHLMELAERLFNSGNTFTNQERIPIGIELK